ncbi:hypothetical protein ACP70R_029086 [Stipagrostis hirtigluma subsp. patula]
METMIMLTTTKKTATATRKKQLLPSLLLVILVVAASEVEVVAGETCDTEFPMCVGVCVTRGKCGRCCRQLGYLGGKCDFWRGMACRCCHEDHRQPPLAAAATGQRNNQSRPSIA